MVSDDAAVSTSVPKLMLDHPTPARLQAAAEKRSYGGRTVERMHSAACGTKPWCGGRLAHALVECTRRSGETTMIRCCTWIVRALLLCLPLTRAAYAFVDTPYLTPASPRAGDDVQVNVRFGGCDVFVAFPGAYPSITREGNTVRILFFGYSYVDSELCYFEPYTTSPSIGQFQPGDYVIQVDWMFGGMGDYQTVHLATLPLTVTGAGTGPVPAPASSWPALFLLILVLLTIAGRELRNSPRKHLSMSCKDALTRAAPIRCIFCGTRSMVGSRSAGG